MRICHIDILGCCLSVDRARKEGGRRKEEGGRTYRTDHMGPLMMSAFVFFLHLAQLEPQCDFKETGDGDQFGFRQAFVIRFAV